MRLGSITFSHRENFDKSVTADLFSRQPKLWSVALILVIFETQTPSRWAPDEELVLRIGLFYHTLTLNKLLSETESMGVLGTKPSKIPNTLTEYTAHEVLMVFGSIE